MTAPATLRRALGRWDLVAIGVNQVIGSGIFLLPSLVTEQIGAWAVVAFAVAGLASLLVALSTHTKLTNSSSGFFVIAGTVAPSAG